MKKPRYLRRRRHRLATLMSAALALPGVTAATPAAAQNIADQAVMRLQYSWYRDRQAGGEDRMEVESPQLFLRAPLTESLELETTLLMDTMSGASPYYLDTLSGASGVGVKDRRKAAEGKLTQYFDRWSLGAGAVWSDEDDYRSRGGVVDARLWSSDRNTTATIAVALASDEIASTNDPTLDEDRQTSSLLVGVTQVLDRVSLVQSNLTWSSADGYLSDPYKFLDSRPRSRDQYAWLLRYNRFVRSVDAALHLDYRLSWDSWSVSGHTLAAELYRPVLEHWTVNPSIRYYTQSAAAFFEETFPPAESGGFYSADQRLAAFGGLTAGLKLIRTITPDLSVDLSWHYLQQQGSWRAGGGGTTSIDHFYAHFVSLGITRRF